MRRPDQRFSDAAVEHLPSWSSEAHREMLVLWDVHYYTRIYLAAQFCDTYQADLKTLKEVLSC